MSQETKGKKGKERANSEPTDAASVGQGQGVELPSSTNSEVWAIPDPATQRRVTALDMAINSLGGVAKASEVLPVAAMYDNFLRTGSVATTSVLR